MTMMAIMTTIFHGRDVFAPVAGHLAIGVGIKNFGPALNESELVQASYDEAKIIDKKIFCRVIHINHFGSLHLNITHAAWDSLKLREGDTVIMTSKRFSPVHLPVGKIFSDVLPNLPLILKDDYGRIEIAVNLGSFVDAHPLSVGEDITLELA